jgi:hypothetical protein
MNIGFDMFTFDENNIFFTEKKKNNIIQGIFTKLFYSTESYTMNGIYIKLPVSIKNNHFVGGVGGAGGAGAGEKNGSISINYSNIQSGKGFYVISSIEEKLLDQYKKYTKTHKTPIYSLKTQLMYGSLKIYRENTSTANTALLAPTSTSISPNSNTNTTPNTSTTNSLTNHIPCEDDIVHDTQNYPLLCVSSPSPYPPNHPRDNNGTNHPDSKKNINENDINKNGSFLSSQNMDQLLLKIAGIWENDTTFGITFKFLYE